jgi:hypothetical protein
MLTLPYMPLSLVGVVVLVSQARTIVIHIFVSFTRRDVGRVRVFPLSLSLSLSL